MRTKVTVACALTAFAAAAGGTAEANGLIHTANIARGAITLNRLAPGLQKQVKAHAKNGVNGIAGAPGLNGTAGPAGTCSSRKLATDGQTRTPGRRPRAPTSSSRAAATRSATREVVARSAAQAASAAQATAFTLQGWRAARRVAARSGAHSR